MNDKNLEICFFGTYDRNFTSNRIVLEGLRINGVEVLEINSEVKLTQLDRETDMTWLHFIKRILRKYQIIVEVAKNIKELKECTALYVGYPGHVDVIPAFIISKLFKLKLIFNPLVIIYTGYADDQGILKGSSLLGKAIKFGEKTIYRLCDMVIADTPYQKKHLMDEYGVSENKLAVLPIGADDKVYRFLGIKKPDNEFNVVYYGLFTPLHGCEYIIQAANILKKHKDIKFVMVGKGHTFDSTFKMAQKLQLKNVIFYPDMTEIDAFDTLKEADVFLGFLQKHPSVDRIIPNKVYQGIALGKAVISARSKAIESVFKDKEDIYLCEPADGNSLAQGILILKNSSKLRNKIARNGYKLFTEKFSPKVVGRELKTIIKAVAGKSQKG